MRVGAGGRTVLERPIAYDDVGLDGALGGVVVRGESGHVQEREEAVVVRENPFAEPSPGRVGIDIRGEGEQPVLGPSNASGLKGSSLDLILFSR